jgi:hypothetical protein
MTIASRTELNHYLEADLAAHGLNSWSRKNR